MSRSSPFVRAFAALLVVAAAVVAIPAMAQTPTATLRGHVSNEGQAVPGVSVTAKSPQLQGSRTVTSSSTGDYVLVSLPPGEYTISFAISGFQTVTKSATLAASQTSTVDAVMNIAGVEATTTATAKAEVISEAATDSTTFSQELLNKLPVARTIASAVNLTPGVNANGPNGAFTISGAQSFDNLYTVNGAVITDNVRGTPNNLFIEDAVQETTTSVSSISAEFGRFQGGVINTITKSGGNQFSGTIRATLNNDAWTATTPLGENRIQALTPTYEATLGGPILKDRVWFFGAARIPKTTESALVTSSPANLPYTFTDLEKRYEGKLTITPFQNHTLMGSYIRIDREQGNYGFTPLPLYDYDSLYTRQLPQELFSGNYNGVLTDKLFVEAQYSARRFTFENSGSRFSDLIKGTVLHDQTHGGYFHSPIFCAVCPGSAEKRDNDDLVLKATYFLSTPGVGSHQIAVGFDDFSGSRLSNNYQSGSNYFINVTDAIFRNGDIFPVVDSSTYLGFYPIPHAAEASDTRTYSFFINDQWKLNDRMSFNLGVRYDKNRAKDSAGAITADDSDFSPRLAATIDPMGTGKLRFNVSYAKYVGAIQDTQAGAASGFGAPAAYYYSYDGPEINTDPNATLLTRAQVIQQVFNWYGITAPNQFPQQGSLLGASIPGLNTQIRETLKSPSTDEFSVGVAGQIGSRGSFRVDGVYRNAKRFYAIRTDTTTGIVTDSLGNEYDLGIVQNLDDPLKRKYYGMTMQFAYRLTDSLNLGGNWTWSHTYGNFVGETGGSGPVQSAALQYPEYKQERWNYPTGDLSQDQRHKIRLYATYDLPLPKTVGTLTLSALEQYDTGTPYGAAGQVRANRYVTNPGYATPPSGSTSPTYYFTARDAFRTDNINRTDLSLNYAKSIGPVELFVQPQVLNVFNAHGGILVNTTVRSRASTSTGGLADFNPFTTANPIECPQGASAATCSATGANWQKGSLFGTVTSVANYQLPRTFRLTMGLRF